MQIQTEITLTSRFIVTIFLLSFTGSLASSAQSNNKKMQLDYMGSHYTALPKQKLDSISAYLDYAAVAEQCFKFIPNEDNTKFVAYYMVDKASDSYNKIHREFGGTYNGDWFYTRKPGQIEVMGYTVWGIFYQGNWYYDMGDYVERYENNLDEARINFLMNTLTGDNFFKGNRPVENPGYWKRNAFKNTIMVEEYPDKPQIVAFALLSKHSKEEMKLDKQIENAACIIRSGLWKFLHESDSTTYYTEYKLGESESCPVLYNPERNRVLMPIMYYDKQNQLWLTYYALLLSSTDTTLYKWKTIPSKKVNRTGSQSLEIVYDIRTFITNWGWGTVDMVSYPEFWEKNFTDSTLEKSEYQYNAKSK